MNIPPDDPRLTEYALGEMSEGDSAQFEAAMADDPPTFDEVHEIREAASTLLSAAAGAPVHSLTDTQRHRLLRLAEAPAPETLAAHQDNLVRPNFWGWFGRFAAGAAAAAVAIASLFFAYQQGYKKAVVDSNNDLPGKGAASAGERGRNETPVIRITIPNPEGVTQQAASRPLSHHAVIPIAEGHEDALVAAVPKVFTPDVSPSETLPETGDPKPGESEPDPSLVPDGRLPVASPDSADGAITVPVASIMENPFVDVNTAPRSSFPLRASPDSYGSVVGAIRGMGQLPDPSSIAVEEIVNAFTYAVPGFVPKSSYEHPFAAGAEVFSCPWNSDHRLVRITLSAPGSKRDVDAGSDPKAVAEDIELLVEFNRTRVARYRLIGFDGAGILSAVGGASPAARSLFTGDTVTALYEVVPAEGASPAEDFRYAPHNYAAPPRDRRRELLCLSITYQNPVASPDGVEAENDTSARSESESPSLIFPVIDPGLSWNRSSADFQFAAAAAAFGMILSGSEHTGEFGFEQIHALAERSLKHQKNPDANRIDFLELVRQAERVARP